MKISEIDLEIKLELINLIKLLTNESVAHTYIIELWTCLDPALNHIIVTFILVLVFLRNKNYFVL